MKKIFTVLLLLLLSSNANAGAVYSTLGDMMSGVRNKLAYESKALPDSIVKQVCRDGLLAVSVEIGGLEATFRVVTVENTAFYAIPDTIIEVVKTTLLNGKRTNSVRPIDPDYYEYTGEELPPELGEAYSADKNDVSFGYDVWADSIQLTPTPIKVDTLYLKCLIEHPNIDSAGTILLKNAYTEAAILYAASYAMDYLKDYEVATYWMNKYDKKMAKLLARYKPKYSRGSTTQ